MVRNGTSLVVSLALLTLGACDSQVYDIGTSEPIRVRGATLHRGELPGTPSIEDGGVFEGPRITLIENISGIATVGQEGKSYSGRASGEAYAIGVAIPGLSNGYWTFPVADADPTAPGEYSFAFTLDFSRDVPPGTYALALVAIDRDGNAGLWRTSTLCVVPDVQDNLNTCDPTIAPPNTVITLSWDTQVDLDLIVVTPEGKVVRSKTPSTVIPTDGGISNAQLGDAGRLTRDSNSSCNIDGARLESLLFRGTPPPGRYTVYANLFDACSEQTVRYHAAIYRAYLNDDGTTYRTERENLASGQLVALQVDNDGSALGTRLAEIDIP